MGEAIRGFGFEGKLLILSPSHARIVHRSSQRVLIGFPFRQFPNARARLTQATLDPIDRHKGPRIMLPGDTMRALPLVFADIDDPCRHPVRHA